jgi:hypothetical protein
MIDQNNWGSVTNDARCTYKIKIKIALVKVTFNKKKALFASKWDINFTKKLVKWYIWSIALHGVENWTLRKVDQRCSENFETLGSDTDCVRN